MPLGLFLRRTGAVALDPALLLFAALVAFVLDFGLGAVQGTILLVPGLIAIAFATSALTKYATLVTRAIALGHDVPAADHAVFDYFRQPWAFTPWVVLAVIAVTAWGLSQWPGPWAAGAALLLLLPLLPAIIAVTCVNASLLTLFRLAALARVIRILGSDYLKVLGGWAAIIAASHILPVGGYTAFGFVLPVAEYPSALLFCLQILWLFTSTGVVLYHHYLPLGIPVERLPADERAQRREDAAVRRERQAALDEAYGYFSRGNEVGGMRRLRRYLEAHDDHDAWAWFAERMRDWESPRAFLLVAKNYLPRLLEAGNEGAALELLVQCMQKDPDFSPRPEDRARSRALLDGHAFAERAARWR